MKKLRIWNKIKGRNVYGYIYLLLIPVFAFGYCFIDNGFYHSTIKYEKELENKRLELTKKLENEIRNAYLSNSFQSNVNKILEKTRNVVIDSLYKEIYISNVEVKDNYFEFYLYCPFFLFSDSLIAVVYESRDREKILSELMQKIPLSNNCDLLVYIYQLSYYKIPEDFKNGQSKIMSTDFFPLIVNLKIDRLINIPEVSYNEHFEVNENNNYSGLTKLNTIKEVLGKYNINNNEMFIYLNNFDKSIKSSVLSEELKTNLVSFSKTYNGYPQRSFDNFLRMLYLSIVTITTLGFGDIVPVTTLARMMISLESVLGIIFIGLFLNKLSKQRR